MDRTALARLDDAARLHHGHGHTQQADRPDGRRMQRLPPRPRPPHPESGDGECAVGLRLSFSCGHDANRPLVERLKGDLEADGHTVSFDQGKTRDSDAWRRRISEGLATTDLTLGFLSRHAARVAGVCLDELPIALPDSAEDVRPPVTVSHIQRLDMQDRARQRLPGEITEPYRPLDPVPQLARTMALIEGFVGRRWLLDKPEAWRRDRPDSKVCWLAGEPGMGKSAFAASVAHFGRGDVVALSLSAWNLSETSDPARVIRSLAFQIATRIGGCRHTPLARLRRDARLLGAQPTGLFHRLVVEPLHGGIDGGQRREPFPIVLDALDKTMRDGRCELAEVIGEMGNRLPGRVNLFVTTREDTLIRQHLGALTPLRLGASEADSRADLLLCALGWLAGPERGAAGEADAQRVAEAADGNMLYPRMPRLAIEAGQIALDDRPRLPAGRHGIHARWFERRFPDRAGYDRDIRRLLGLLLATSAPLPEAALREAFGWSAVTAAARREAPGGLFETPEAGWAHFRKSLRDRLPDERAATSRRMVDREDGARRLREVVWARFLRWVDRPDGAVEPFLVTEFPRAVAADAERPAATAASAVGDLWLRAAGDTAAAAREYAACHAACHAALARLAAADPADAEAQRDLLVSLGKLLALAAQRADAATLTEALLAARRQARHLAARFPAEPEFAEPRQRVEGAAQQLGLPESDP
jgi:hypothetical protein